MARYAAVDIGSNSVRMMAAEVTPAETRILLQDRQVTRLGESVFRTGRVSAEALDFLCATLARMSAGYSQLGVSAVRAVATSAVRDAGNQQEFLRRVSGALSADVEIISGPEEARLIHLGVEARWPRPKERTLIIDVGGGSAELILGQGPQLIDVVSKPLGAVRLTELFLPSDPPAAEQLHRLHAYIDEKLIPFRNAHESEQFDRTVVTSASAAAIISAINGVTRTKRDDADRMDARLSDIRELYLTLTKTDVSGRRKVAGIGPRRAEIIVAGTAVFLRAMELFDLKSINYSVAGVRDGIIADLAVRGVGRDLSRLSEEQRDVVEAMASRYGVAMEHARQVARLCSRLFDILRPIHKLPPEAGRLLESAAYLHDIGHFVSGTGHHKHSAYLIANSDLPGFTDKERLSLAALCRFHRKSMPQSRHPQYQVLDPQSKRMVVNLVPLLRLADSLDRGHAQRVVDISGRLTNGAVVLELQADADADLELWASDQATNSFREVYHTPILIRRAQSAATR